MKKGLQFFFVIVVLLFGTSSYSKTASEVFEAVSSSVVVIQTYDIKGNDQGLGSGVIIEKDLIVTNCHVIEDSAKIQVVYKGKQYLTIVKDTDWDLDICTLTVNGINAPSVVKGSTNRLKVGTKVFAIGAPQGLELTLSEGIISSFRPVDSGQYLQISAPISPGSSGGGLFDEEGKLIGLPTFYITEGQQLNFAVPVEWINELPKRNKEKSEIGDTTSNDSLSDKAEKFITKNDWQGLLDHSLYWTKAQPKEYKAWFYQGFAYYMLSLKLKNAEKRSEAIDAYKYALQINPEYTPAWVNIGNVYLEDGQYDEAIKAHKKALSIEKENMAAWDNLGRDYMKIGQYSEAVNCFKQALSIYSYEDGWSFLGDAYCKISQYAEAIKAYQEALRINPANATIWFDIGVAYGNNNQHDKEIEAYRQALRIDPTDEYTWHNLGLTYYETFQYDEAIKALKQALAISPGDANTWINLGSIYVQKSQYTEAIQACKKAISIDPKMSSAWYILGGAYDLSGQTGNVMEVYKTLKKLDPEKAEKFFNGFVLP